MEGDFQLLLLIVGLLVYFLFLRPSGKKGTKKKSAAFIPDQYKTLEQVQAALRQAGLESSNLIIGVDYTKSNEFQGTRTFGGRCLHDIRPNVMNPYQQAIDVIGRTLEVFDDDKLIPVFGFGDTATADKRVFNLIPEDRPAHGVQEVLSAYSSVTPLVNLSGPTSFKPLINTAIGIVSEEKSYHILLIIADGQVTNEKENIKAIVEASKYPMSIIMIGVGDGPWDAMEKFDDDLDRHGRKFDNFQFVSMSDLQARYGTSSSEAFQAAFALAALQEVPDQFKFLKDNSMIG